MGQPKAKWERGDVDSEWYCEVGPFGLVVSTAVGRWELWQKDPLTLLADNGDEPHVLPCDAADLMRLAEAELARRLHGAAESMDGRELVAEPVAGHDYSVCEECCGRSSELTDGKCYICVMRAEQKRGNLWLLHDGSGAPKPLTYANAVAPKPLTPENIERAIAEMNTIAKGDAPKCQMCGTPAPERYRGKRVITCPECSNPAAPKYVGQVHLTIGPADAEALPRLTSYCDFEDCAASGKHRRGPMTYCDTHAREHDENVAQAKRDNPLMVSVKCFCATGCTVCNGTGVTSRRATPEEKREHEAKKTPPVGSREWAIQQMRDGRAVLDVDGDPWRYDDFADRYIMRAGEAAPVAWGPALPDYKCLDQGWRLK